MIKTQVQIPDDLYAEAKRVAQEREMSLAEVVRRGLEYITRVYPPVSPTPKAWSIPKPANMGECLTPPEHWRLLANDPANLAE